ncbi:isopropylmalate isomerase [Ornatilinea apprima]|uniref:3-isopropylmalate dehydratase large subunit n=1 Tax=Ornatilinea apprima TaxID=1134406 RepID=A0A0P6XMI5_9CHLR|nr:3-isopropylmalate dehydratase large subunit [Ornatilinea apprima]KPL70137.1 isopropylmalate isomerase [Ornatilinea apprima]
MKPRTLFEKIWEAHVVSQQPDAPAILYIDRQYLHEVTSPQAFAGLRERGLPARRPDRAFATVDHSIPTLFVPSGDRLSVADDASKTQIRQLEKNCADFGIPCYDHNSPDQGIVHVIGPEKGLTQPGMTIVCGDSHTSTHGAFGSLAFGIGTSEILQVLATQCLLQRKPKTMLVKIEGKLPAGISAKDIILALIAQIGIGGATGHVIEYGGEAIQMLNMDERMTICNMSIECGARAGMIAPDEVTFDYLKGREYAPSGSAWDAALAAWRQLPSDPGAQYDREVVLNATSLQPMVTFGTNPGMGIPVTASVPHPDKLENESQRAALQKALAYMGLQPGQPIAGQKVDVVFIGSCTNGRITDLRAAAEVLRGRKVADGLTVLVVPGSRAVLRQAEQEGLDRVFIEAGAQWRDAGCSMCIAMNGDMIQPGQYAISTSNRNFEGRQGKGGRTLLASPATAAASAVNGYVTDPREIL